MAKPDFFLGKLDSPEARDEAAVKIVIAAQRQKGKELTEPEIEALRESLRQRRTAL